MKEGWWGDAVPDASYSTSAYLHRLAHPPHIPIRREGKQRGRMPCLSSRNIPIPPSVRALFPTNELVRQRIREGEGDRGEGGMMG